jgi:predicted nucleic acid-binding protein
MLNFDARVQAALLEWIARGALTVKDLDLSSCSSMAAKMLKYADLPMDLADASLVCLAEYYSIIKIMTFDSDFKVYKTKNGKKLENILVWTK